MITSRNWASVMVQLQADLPGAPLEEALVAAAFIRAAQLDEEPAERGQALLKALTRIHDLV